MGPLRAALPPDWDVVLSPCQRLSPPLREGQEAVVQGLGKRNAAGSEGNLVQEAAVRTATEAAVLDIAPVDEVGARAQSQAVTLPSGAAADLVMEQAIDPDLQIVMVCLGGDLPIEGEDPGTVDGGLQPGVPVVADVAALGVNQPAGGG